MADEIKPLVQLRKAIDAYLQSFDYDVIHMTPSHPDNRFPDGFLETFVELFIAQCSDQWSIVDDPNLTIPKRIMEELFQKEKEKLTEELKLKAPQLQIVANSEPEVQANLASPSHVTGSVWPDLSHLSWPELALSSQAAILKAQEVALEKRKKDRKLSDLSMLGGQHVKK